MKFVLAPDSYKGSLTAKQACDAMEIGIRRVIPQAEIIKVPMADGGEGTVQSVVDAMNGRIVRCEVMNPIGETVTAQYGILGDNQTAVIEMAEASGLYLISEMQRNPLTTTTYGTGQLVMDALNKGCRQFVIGLGGSATNDGGAGMMQALGAMLLDRSGNSIAFGGEGLGELDRIDLSTLDPRVKESRFTAACDVDNPLTGPSGASEVFGRQKGASAEMIKLLDQNLEHLASVISRDLKVEVDAIPGAGAAGGLGAGLVAFLEAKLSRGIEIVKEIVQFESLISGADFVFSGEGRCDFQTERGKTPYGVAKAAQKYNIPVILIAGSIGPGVEVLYQHGVKSIFSMMDGPMSVEQAMQHADQLLANAAERVVRLLQ